MRKIPLSNSDKVALVDEEDYPLLKTFRWSANSAGYAQAWVGNTVCFMHRIIMRTPIGMHTDHINHQPLDNRKKNLRICTNSQNQGNRIKSNGSGSAYKGVIRTRQGKYKAQLTRMGKYKYLGTFECEVDAAEAYNHEALLQFGEYASLNEIVPSSTIHRLSN